MSPPSAAEPQTPSRDDEAARATIMLVDDDPVYRSLMRPALEDAGYAVIEAVDGLAALHRIDDAAPVLAVVDAVMPNLDGFALCQELRARSTTRHLPILMATGLDDEASIANAYDAGATDFITKPVDGPTLVRRIRYMLRGAVKFESLRQDLQRLTVGEPSGAAHGPKEHFGA